jgi:hypothetical protein
MAITPDKEPAGPSKGVTHGGDQTAMPGQAAGKIPFGVGNPLDTGAPGSGGAGTNPDPTVQTPIPGSVFGAGTDDTSTGAPGGTNASAGVKTGANYTIDAAGWYSWMDGVGGSVDTEAQANKYGTDTGIPGLSHPTTTGAPNSGDGGHVGHMHTGL